MTNWVRMEHKATGGYTLVAERSVPSYEGRGWHKADGDKGSALAKPKGQPIRSDKVKEDPTPSTSANENKEDG